MGIPQSQIFICDNLRLNSRYEHTLYFPDIDSQKEFFAGRAIKTLSAYSFLRKSWDLKVNATLAEAESWSYLFFRNSERYEDKWYYYFINSVEYVNDNTVILHLEIDVMQTYMFDYELLPCYIDRQHTTTDEIGEHTIDEGLDCGELIECGTKDLFATKDLCILVLATINPNEAMTTIPAPALACMYNNVFSGLKVWAVKGSDWAAWGNQLEALSEAGFLDGIVNMWMYPKNLVELGGESTWDDDDLCKPVKSCYEMGLDFSGNNDYTPFGGYTPKNNKLYCFPFNFLYLSNNSGSSASYRYDRFTGPNGIHFRVYGTVSPDGGVKIVPVNYNGVAENYEAGMNLGNFPTCAWDSDIYKMWLAQNYNQLNVQGATNMIQAGAGLAMGAGSLLMGNVPGALGGVAMAANGVTQIAQQVAQQKDMQVQPPQARGSLSIGVNMTAGKQCFTIYNKCVDKEHARRIDNFFTLYGYKIGRVQKPNPCTRKTFTYVKTIGCTIDANLCNEHATKIEAIFDKGITFWRVPWKIGNYSVDNTPL